jgi:hypothetical protein
LDVGLRKSRKSVVNLFREWDDEFFHGGGFKKRNRQAGKTGQSDAMRRLMEDEEIASGSELT